MPIYYIYYIKNYSPKILLQKTFRDEKLLIQMASTIIGGSILALWVASDLSKINRRKLFHFIAVFAFLPAIQRNYQMLVFAFNCNICVFIWAEVFRQSFKRDAISNFIDLWFKKFVDEREKTLVTSHLQLLLGCAIPCTLCFIVLDGSQPDGLFKAWSASGILILGIGDSLAAIMGKWLGKLRWRKEHGKTVEGSFYGTIATTLGFYVLTKMYVPEYLNYILEVFLAALVSFFVEG